MSVIVRTPQSQIRMVTKGAVEEMVKVCTHIEIKGEDQRVNCPTA
jgi:Mg2+-importing ATPase